MFGRRRDSAAAQGGDGVAGTGADPAAASGPGQAKGRPTPTRREAEAARKAALKIPKDPRAARKAARERDRKARMEARAGLSTGDERYLPARDRGPVRAFTRDFVDSRFTVAEYFIFIALAVLVLGFIPHPAVQLVVSVLWFVLIAVIGVDSSYLLWRLGRQLSERFPDPAERKGARFYALLRSLQLRRLRLPPPRVKRGGAPAEPRRRR